jgi:predicted kinase
MATIVIIGGLPCTGKSFIAAMLQRHLRWPLLAKDGFKETLFDALGCRDRGASRDLSRVSYALLFKQLDQLIEAGVHCIVEGNFRAEHEPALAQRVAVPHRSIQVLCKAEGATLLERFAERARGGQRHPGHADLQRLAELESELLQGRAEPLRLPGSLFEFDSTHASPTQTSAFVDAVIAAARDASTR